MRLRLGKERRGSNYTEATGNDDAVEELPSVFCEGVLKLPPPAGGEMKKKKDI